MFICRISQLMLFMMSECELLFSLFIMYRPKSLFSEFLNYDSYKIFIYLLKMPLFGTWKWKANGFGRTFSVCHATAPCMVVRASAPCLASLDLPKLKWRALARAGAATAAVATSYSVGSKVLELVRWAEGQRNNNAAQK